jgi:hypothetical protein
VSVLISEWEEIEIEVVGTNHDTGTLASMFVGHSWVCTNHIPFNCWLGSHTEFCEEFCGSDHRRWKTDETPEKGKSPVLKVLFEPPGE